MFDVHSSTTYYRYYDVSTTAVDWTMMIFLVPYIILVIPATTMFERIGLRWSMILSICSVAVGTWIKVFSVSPDRFYLAFIGQLAGALLLVLIS